MVMKGIYSAPEDLREMFKRADSLVKAGFILCSIVRHLRLPC